MNRLFDKYGSYNYTSFMGSSGIWSLHGVEANGDLKNTLDTFHNGKGEFRTYERHQVMEQAGLGNIKPIESSEVKLNTEIDRKPKRRAI